MAEHDGGAGGAGGLGVGGVEEGVGKALDGGLGLDRRVNFVACGPSHTVAIDNEKNVWSWGAQVNTSLKFLFFNSH